MKVFIIQVKQSKHGPVWQSDCAALAATMLLFGAKSNHIWSKGEAVTYQLILAVCYTCAVDDCRDRCTLWTKDYSTVQKGEKRFYNCNELKVNICYDQLFPQTAWTIQLLSGIIF